ncbi:MAG: hypothetical protein A2Z14_19590 [Chloroflexi bacterium RBG_16_48_8]|nr:MAG: hypothetical protein A2Z14_19590 [Chloroflexi bacterium RBG_16_48_8]
MGLLPTNYSLVTRPTCWSDDLENLLEKNDDSPEKRPMETCTIAENRQIVLKRESLKKDLWQLQEAKNNFSEVVNKALSDGPQIITRRGKKVVVILH